MTLLSYHFINYRHVPIQKSHRAFVPSNEHDIQGSGVGPIIYKSNARHSKQRCHICLPNHTIITNYTITNYTTVEISFFSQSGKLSSDNYFLDMFHDTALHSVTACFFLYSSIDMKYLCLYLIYSRFPHLVSSPLSV